MELLNLRITSCGFAVGREFGTPICQLNTKFYMETKTSLNHDTPPAAKPLLAAVYVATWQEEGEVPYQLRSDECKPKDKVGDSDWWFDEESLMFRRYWSYHHELYGNQYVYEEVDAVPLNGC